MRQATRRALELVPAAVHRLLPFDLRADVRHRFGLEAPGDTGYVPEPPPMAPGERGGPPDFIGLGAPNAGGWWWMRTIAEHSEVAANPSLSDVAHFFAPYCITRFGDEQIARFHQFFPRRGGQLTGHWSPDGLAYPWVVPLLAQAAPRAKLLVLVRDPIDRLRQGLLQTIDARPPHPGTYLSDAVERGFYAAQLTRLLQFFPRSQVQVLQLEQCVADPSGAMTKTLQFLGLDDSCRLRPANPDPTTARDGKCLPAPSTVQRLQQMYASDVAELSRMVPDLDLALWPHFASTN